jgi:Leucine-rich repeat (LRR) protein
LRFLDLSANPVIDILPLEGLRRLFALNLSGTLVDDFTALSSLPELAVLNLSRNANARNALGAISILPKLAILSLNDCALGDGADLESISTLEALGLRNNNLKCVPRFQKSRIRQLDLSSNQLNDISSLSECISLGLLNLSRNKVSDLSSLKGCPSLKMICIYDNPISSYPAFAPASPQIVVDPSTSMLLIIDPSIIDLIEYS